MMKLESALKAAETAQASLHAERASSRALLMTEEEIKFLQLQVVFHCTSISCRRGAELLFLFACVMPFTPLNIPTLSSICILRLNFKLSCLISVFHVRKSLVLTLKI